MVVKPFVNETQDGNERALKKGWSVPREGLPLSYAKAPRLSPKDNVVIVDTSRAVEQNVTAIQDQRAIYFANSLGILIDGDDNAVVSDDRPYVTDVFSTDDDYTKVPESAYTPEAVLPFLHVSRHFHVDSPALTVGDELLTFDNETVRVVDNQGREYTDSVGNRRYKIKIVPAVTRDQEVPTWSSPTEIGSLVAWWDPLDINDVNDAQPVSEWEDISGLEVTLAQTTEDNQPLWYGGILPQGPSVGFDGDASMQTDSIDRWNRLHDGSEHTVAIVVRNDADNAGRVLSTLNSLSNGSGTLFTYASSGTEVRRVINSGGTAIVDDSASVGDDDIAIIISRVQNDEHLLRVNGNEVTSTASGAFDTGDSAQDGLTVGAMSPSDHSLALDGHLGDIVVVDKALDSQEISSLESWLIAKYKNILTIADATGDEPPERDSWAYRVHVYIDSKDVSELRLEYNKVEVRSDGTLDAFHSDWQERLNPIGLFEYRPEESEVVDPDNRKERIFSSKSINQKERLLGNPDTDVDGYKIYVPKKAVGDPRIYQLFRWRIVCEFTKEHTVDLADDEVLYCGVAVTSDDLSRNVPSQAAYALYNLERSHYNVTNTTFRNPLRSNHGNLDKEKRSYWLVNIDEDDISQFDLLIWTPTEGTDTNQYASKIDDYVRNHNGSMFIETTTRTSAMSNVVDVSGSLRPNGIAVVSEDNDRVDPSTLRTADTMPEDLERADLHLGGWSLRDEQDILYDSISFMQARGTAARFLMHDDEYAPVFEAQDTSSDSWEPVASVREIEWGRIFQSTLGVLATCSRLFDHTDGSQVSRNYSSRIADVSNYQSFINGSPVQGAMKTLFNVALKAVRARSLVGTEEDSFSTVWHFPTPWRGSWVIDANQELLNEEEREVNLYSLEPRDLTAEDPDDTPIWKRQLDESTVEELIDRELQKVIDNPGVRARAEGASRSYTIEITNPKVYTHERIFGEAHPWAWTDAYSPRFVVPPDIGPHVVKQERNEEGELGVEGGEWDELTYSYRVYPERPYGGYVVASYIQSEVDTVASKTNWKATGEARLTSEYEVEIPGEEYEVEIPGEVKQKPDREETKTREVELSWWDAPQTGSREWVLVHDTDSRESDDVPRMKTPWKYIGWPHGIRTWQGHNYYTSNWGPGHQNWPDYGQTVRVVRGSRGDHVKFIQEALNRFMDASYMPGNRLAVDGIYGPRTSGAVETLQSTMEARYVDGVVDAETWAIIGYQILRSNQLVRKSSDGGDWTHWFTRPEKAIQWQNISNFDTDVWWAKRSWIENGPSVIWDLLQIVFDRKYEIIGATIVPFVSGRSNTDDIMVRSVDVRNQPFTLRNYDPNSGIVTNLPHRPKDGEEHFVPIDQVRGNTLIVGVGQDRGTGWGSSRQFGVRDVRARAKIKETVTIPGEEYQEEGETVTKRRPSETITKTKEEDVELIDTGTVTVESFTDTTRRAQAHHASEGTLSNVRWNSVSVDNDNVNAEITSSGKITFSSILLDYTFDEDKARKGPDMPGGIDTYYAMNINKQLFPFPETGYVSRQDGVKLLCDENRRPVGFPPLPTGVSGDSTQRHFTRYTLKSDGNHSSVEMHLYDQKRDEFIVNDNGDSEMSYLEYMRRGPHNVYIAVTSDYQRVEEETIPQDDDSPLLPQRWAYPVYGVHTEGSSRIHLESLPPNLSVRDMWPLAIRDGRFTRSIKLSRFYDMEQLPEYLADYKGDEVTAVYALPETNASGFSLLYGPPWADVRGEIPEIVADDLIRVRQTPIMMLRYPTVRPTHADPMRPVIEFQVRDEVGAPWKTLSWKDFADWDTSTGEVYLKQRLTHNDPRLIRANYTVERQHYYLKSFENEVINLNPYSQRYIDQMRFEGKGLYVYILPYYMRDSRGRVIEESVAQETVHVTTDPSIFDPLDPDYNPTAIMLGVVYVIPGSDPEDVSMFDVRRRGGGVRDDADLEEVTRVANDATSYWDISTFTGTGYQESGFIIVRLPEELKDRFTTGEIKETLHRNVAAGVEFKIEDIKGNEWESEEETV